PNWKGPRSSPSGPIRVGCLSGELYECADVLHIGNKGGVVGLKADAFPNNSVNGLLERWLKGGFFRFLHIAGNERRYIKIPHPFEGTLLDKLETAFINNLEFAPASETNITIQWPRTADAPLQFRLKWRARLSPPPVHPKERYQFVLCGELRLIIC